jgi:N-acetylmuramoyl-L-alanine amidase
VVLNLVQASKKTGGALISAIFITVLIQVPAWSTALAGPPLLFPDKTPMVAVDPGHGGRDSGARGPTGLLEKTVCLELARKLAARLETRYRVTLTRSDDYQVEAPQRAAIANAAGADVLISLHTGGSYVHSTRAMTIYYYAPLNPTANTPQSSTEALDRQRWDQTQLRHQAASLALATALKPYLEQIPGAPVCDIRGAPLVQLEGADMPAVLIEIGRISHPATEAELREPQEQELLAEQIFKGTQAYLVSIQK